MGAVFAPSWSGAAPNQVLLSKNLCLRPGCRQTSLARNSGVGGGGPDFYSSNDGCSARLSGPLNRLNARLSQILPLDRCRNSCVTGCAIRRPLSCPISHPDASGISQPPRSKPLR